MISASSRGRCRLRFKHETATTTVSRVSRRYLLMMSGRQSGVEGVQGEGPYYLEIDDNNEAKILLCILAIQILDFLFHLTDFHGQVVHLSEILTIRFDHDLVNILL